MATDLESLSRLPHPFQSIVSGYHGVSSGYNMCNPFSDSERSADVIQDPDEDIPVSAVIIAAKSRVLRAMLSSGMKESDARAPIHIRVSAEERDAFQEMIRFTYAGGLSPRLLDAAADVRELVQLLLVGDKFEVPSLIGAAAKSLSRRKLSFLDCTVMTTQVPDALQTVPLIKNLVENARASIVDRFRDVSATWSSEEFLDLDIAVLAILLEFDRIEAESEEVVFERVTNWVRHNVTSATDEQAALDQLSPHVRFLCMSEKYLEGLLSEAEAPSESATWHAKISSESTTWRLVKEAIVTKKTKGWDQTQAPYRQGLSFELVGDFSLHAFEGHLRCKVSPWVVWHGREWHIDMWNGGRNCPLYVGLSCKAPALTKVEESAPNPVRVLQISYSIFAKEFPSRNWRRVVVGECQRSELIHTGTLKTWYCPDGLGVTWEEAKTSRELVGPTGAISVKIVICRV